jgi:hypothetical protein
VPFVHRLNIVNQTTDHRLRRKGLIEAASDGTPVALGKSYAPATILAPLWQPDDEESDDIDLPTPLALFPDTVDAGKSVGLHLEHAIYLTSRSWISYFLVRASGTVSKTTDTIDVDLSLTSFDGTPATANPAVRFGRAADSNLEYRYVDVLSNTDSTGNDLDQRNSLIVVRDRPSQGSDTPSKALLVVFKVADPGQEEQSTFVVDLLSTKVEGDTALGAGRLDWEALDTDADGEADVESLMLMAIPGATKFGFSAKVRVVDNESDNVLLVVDISAGMRQGSSGNSIYTVDPKESGTSSQYQVHARDETVTSDYEVFVVLVTPANSGSPDPELYQTRLQDVRTGIEPGGASGSGSSSGTNNTRKGDD